MHTYDLVVIGGGPAGYLAGERAAQAGLSVCVAEKRALGGVCLNEGCIPTKTLLHSAKMADYARGGTRYGVTGDAQLDHAKVIDRKNMVVKQLVTGIEAKLRQHNVDTLRGNACLAGKQDGLFAVQVDGQTLLARHLLIATGSEAVVPPIPGAQAALETGFAVTSREILDWREIPPRLTVIGGGVIGLELASYFCSAGSKVTVLEMLPSIAGLIDGDIAANLQKNLQKKGIVCKPGCTVTDISASGVAYTENADAKTVECDRVLLAVGRRPNTAGLGLETLGVACERGAILTDAQMRTNVPGVYAAGDVNGRLMLAHTAYREAEVAVNSIIGTPDTMDYSCIASVIYTSPEVGVCGETLASAREKGIPAREVSLSMRYSGRYLAEVAGGDGIAKLVFDERTDRLIGAHLIGSYASEIILAASVLIERHMTVPEIKKLVFPHPTVGEIIREAVFAY